MPEKTPKTRLPRLLLAADLLMLLWLLFGRDKYDVLPYWEQVAQNCNLVPLRTIRLFVQTLLYAENPYLHRHAIINLVGNVLVFVPTGVLLPWAVPKLRDAKRFLLWSAAGIALVEVLQLFSLRGSLDIDDLLLNLPGLLLGFALYRRKTRSRNRKSRSIRMNGAALLVCGTQRRFFLLRLMTWNTTAAAAAATLAAAAVTAPTLAAVSRR